MAQAANVLFEKEDYRAVLREELTRRRARNLEYSQRAFARDLKIGPNRLSEILNGKQGLSSMKRPDEASSSRTVSESLKADGTAASPFASSEHPREFSA